ncbi:MAG: dihydrodipicolinate synthase family protein [Chloroflexi bacterium]|nr:dihydrodipicolinate synthase family protein [Chloroflexota bacterium]MCH8816593.1 dihydrodipicolinate synthase family protein [Chloroflexota bacterium]
MPADTRLNGIHFMLPTPFTEEGEIDIGPFKRLVDCAAASGCTGVVCLGVMGEAHRLADKERIAALEAVVEAAGDRLTVTVGVSSDSNRLVALRTKEAQDRGATAVMVAPARMAKPNEAVLYGYYDSVQSVADIPIVVQDFPAESGVFMSVQFIARLNAELPGAQYLKLEDPPTPPKITQILALTGDNMGIFGGLGGSFLFEELRRGGVGTMTGFAYPEVLVALYRLIGSGDIEGGRKLFYDWVPYVRYENQPGIGLSIRKYAMMKRGLLDNFTTRPPSPMIDKATQEELDDILSVLPEIPAV